EALVAFTAHELEGSPLLRELESARPAGEQAPAAPGIIGSNAKLLAALDRLRRLSRSEMPILLTGESGTGKELAAALVHGESSRSARPFVPFNCAAVSENLLLSDLFGHVRGAFTGADRERLGVFEAAGGGTVFLDEIGDLPLSCQGMLLRLIQEGEVRRLGESLPRKVKVRLVAATHRDLAQMVSEGTFRQDLYFRLKVAAVKLPALRERLDDLPALCRHFLRKLLPGGSLSKAAEQALASYRWPGNIRELGNVLAVAAALAEGEGGWIEPHHLDLETKARATSTSDFHTQLDSFRRQLIQQALEASGGNQAEAARRLGLTRQALSYLVRRAS
ncbi:MAG TPA: sigma 54-interacting transcriptional regulator, partial [Thermoanaerobaculia bacterium]|nr:sigma 54-interacting transcriptional regulator [Thermoanaerobaculia bacterium]